MNQRKSALLRSLGAAMLLASLGTLASAQVIPASSADSGRRATITVNQADIYNKINNAQYTGDVAYNSSVNAYNAAVNAYNRAGDAIYTSNEALAKARDGANGSMASGFVDFPNDSNNSSSLPNVPTGSSGSTGGYLRCACIVGAPGPNWLSPGPNQATYCPAGAAWVAFSWTGNLTDGGGGGGH